MSIMNQAILNELEMDLHRQIILEEEIKAGLLDS